MNFGTQQWKNCIIHLLGCQLLLIQQLRNVLQVCVRSHVHVDARRKTAYGGIGRILGESMRGQIVNGPRVGDDKAMEVPIVSQHIMKQPVITARRNVVQVHVGAHDATYTCIHRCVEWR